MEILSCEGGAGKNCGLGFGFLYDMLVGRIDFHITPRPDSEPGERKVLDEDDAAAAEADPATLKLIEVAHSVLNMQLRRGMAEFVLRRTHGDIGKAVEYLRTLEPSRLVHLLDQSEPEGDKIVEADEGPRLVQSR